MIFIGTSNITITSRGCMIGSCSSNICSSCNTNLCNSANSFSFIEIKILFAVGVLMLKSIV